MKKSINFNKINLASTLMISLLLGIGLMGLCSFSMAQNNPWTQKADMPTGRQNFAASVVDGKIFALGGYNTNRLLTVYDPMFNTWSTKTPMPTSRMILASGVANGKIYAIGGVVAPLSPAMATVEMYDPATDTWTTKTPMPTSRMGLGTSVVDGKIYAIGGMTSGSNFWSGMHKTVEVYDPVTDTWSAKKDMPTARCWLSTSVVNGKIYAIGGALVTRQPLATVEEYDPVTDTWTTKTPMPTARMGHAAAVIDGIIYVFGGGTVSAVPGGFSVVEAYDPVTDTWTPKAELPEKRAYLCASTVGGKIYAIGGIPDGSNPNLPGKKTVYEYDPSKDFIEGTLEKGEITSLSLEGNLIGDNATKPFAVYLPPGYETSERRYPAFYVFHGFSGNAGSMTGMRFTLDRMIGNGEIGEMIAVFVDGTTRFGGVGQYSSVTIGDYETYITRDLVNYIDAHYRTIPQPDSRGITGESAGAGGALHLALKFPNVFGVVVAQAGHYDWDTDWHKAWATKTAVVEDWNDYDGEAEATAVLAKAAFAAPNPDKPPFFLDKPYELVNGEAQFVPEAWEKLVNHDLMHNVDRYQDQPVRLNAIKIVHGSGDPYCPVEEQGRAMDRKLTDLGIDHVYVEHSGGHVFVAEESLSFFELYLNRTSPSFLNAPIHVAAELTDITKVELTWEDTNDDEIGFRIERAEGDTGSFTTAAEVQADVTSYVDSVLNELTLYYYRVITFNDSLTSGYERVAAVTTLSSTSLPAAVSGPSPENNAVNIGADTTLMWKASVNADSYDVYFGAENPPPFVINQVETKFEPGELEKGKKYYWRIDGKNSNGTTEGPIWSFTVKLELPSGQIAYWKFDETEGTTASDEGGYGLDGELMNMSPSSWTDGITDGGLSFDGVDDYVKVPHSGALDFADQSFSISLCVKVHSFPGEMYLIHKGTFAREWFGIQMNNGELRFPVDDGITKSQAIATVFSLTLKNKWAHIAAVRERAEGILKLYLNGEIVASATDGTGSISQEYDLLLGNCSNFDASLSGVLDEVRIFNYALSEAEVQAICESLTDVESIKETVPNEFGLAQNYPNPFNPKTIIGYSLPVTCEVDLSVYNILGQKVSTLVNKHQNAGTYKVNFNASNLSSGTYFYKLLAGEFQETKKMLQIK